MLTLIDLYARCEAQGIEVDDVPMRKVVSASFRNGWIAIDTAKIETSAEEKTILAHELGHLETDSFYNIYSKFDLRSKHERHATTHAIRILIPRDELATAITSGLAEIWELADHFGVTIDFMHAAIDYYNTQYNNQIRLTEKKEGEST